MNNDLDSIFVMNEMLNRAGMDTISAGGTLAFAMECWEKGLLTARDTDGIDLTWGNSTGLIDLLKKMIQREKGIGDLLADGAREAARRIGRGAMAYAVHAGGQEIPMHDGRFDPGFALHYSVEPTPGRHTIGSQLYYEMFQLWKRVKGLPDVNFLYFKDSKYDFDEEKARAAAACSCFINVLNGAGGCLFGAFLGVHRLPVFEWLNAATGWSYTPEQYMETGKRIQTLRQAFNVKHGVEPSANVMSDRALGRPPLKEGANAGRTIEIEKMVRGYWRQFGWDERTGHPGISGKGET